MKLLNTSATKLKIAAGLRPPVYYKLKDRFTDALKKFLPKERTDKGLAKRKIFLKK